MHKLTRTTKYRYNDMLEVLPPAAMTHGRTRDGITFSCFLVGEPMNHRANGEAVYSSYFTCNDEYYAGETMTAGELYDLANRPDELQTAIANADEPAEDSDDERILEAIDEHNEEIVEAFASCFSWQDVTADAITGAYSGQYDSDEEFAQDMAEQLGDIDEEAKWPHSYIDWERAARDLMYDYCEHDGYYFRNI